MPTHKRKMVAAKIRRTRRTRMTRRTRKYKGGECDPMRGVKAYKDFLECVKAECDERMCAKFHHWSMPHKDPEQTLTEQMLRLQIAENELKKRREESRTSRKSHRESLRGPLSVILNPNTPPVQNKTRIIQGWPVQEAWGENLPELYKSLDYTSPRYSFVNPSYAAE